MTTPAWPVGLPQNPLTDGARRSPSPSVTFFGTEVGPGKQRRRSTARTKPFQCSFHVTSAQAETFETFFEDDLADGVLPFTWPDPLTGDTVRWRFAPDSPYDLAPVAQGGDAWTLSVRLMRLD